ncbi:excalibur calcium-binding domain-containing protein [Mycolicibacterium fallax]|uniref:Uncharacterized protein n=1 Tax=Mycolicibacterium fallax TaxID=1793 RepID=A0A1X1R824_MYCFA|nr:excalibur calcium-binding domain-containing protein [Mycolicibacterium fallax]ORV01136.1 hypothetical protein AWC04_14195 [Mycolicibacterium fallax]BBY98278.1 hypothetical protein MFAL_17450 [Mycolicibacterium fallax]
MIRALLAAVAISAVGVNIAPVAVAAPYKNCTEARKNGDTNIPSSSDKYGEHLDRDGDGFGCES